MEFTSGLPPEAWLAVQGARALFPFLLSLFPNPYYREDTTVACMKLINETYACPSP